MVNKCYLFLMIIFIGCNANSNVQDRKIRTTHEKSFVDKTKEKHENESPNTPKCLPYIIDSLNFELFTDLEIITLDSLPTITSNTSNEIITNWLSYNNLKNYFEIKEFEIRALVGRNVNGTGFYVNFYDWLIIIDNEIKLELLSLNENNTSFLKKNGVLYFNKVEFSDNFMETKNFEKMTYNVSLINILNNKVCLKGFCNKEKFLKLEK